MNRRMTKSQIAEYLREHNGEGIQHIALGSNDIYRTVSELRANGMDFMPTPDIYYDNIDKRLPDTAKTLSVCAPCVF